MYTSVAKSQPKRHRGRYNAPSSSCMHILSLYLYSYQLSRYNDAMTCCRDTAVQIVCDRFTVAAKFRRLYILLEKITRIATADRILSHCRYTAAVT